MTSVSVTSVRKRRKESRLRRVPEDRRVERPGALRVVRRQSFYLLVLLTGKPRKRNFYVVGPICDAWSVTVWELECKKCKCKND